MARLKTATAVSAGGVVYRREGDELQVVLCGRLPADVWGLPKGTPQPGEDLLQTALREVREETGLDADVISPLGDIAYWFVARGIRFHKVVHFYLMVPTGGDFSRHDPEYDVVEWFPLASALRRVAYQNEVTVLRRAADAIQRLEEANARVDGS